MDLKAALGDQYREDMTMAEIASAFESLNLVDPATLPPSVDKATFDRTASELAALKKKNKERMSEDEQRAAQQQEILDQLATMQKENAQMKQEKAFLAGGYDAKTASKLAECLSNGDMNGFIQEQSRFAAEQKETAKAEAKAELMKDFTPIGGAGGKKNEEDPLAVKMAKSLLSKSSGGKNSPEDIINKFK